MSDVRRTCCVCHEPCVDNAEGPKRWSWGPDGAHCHFECEAEFKRRYPWLAPADHAPRGPQRRFSQV
jgi:hypothetical protein